MRIKSSVGEGLQNHDFSFESAKAADENQDETLQPDGKTQQHKVLGYLESPAGGTRTDQLLFTNRFI